MPGISLSPEEVAAVIQQVRNEIKWKPGSRGVAVKEIEEWILAYETDVRFPDVSGMEHQFAGTN